MYNINYMAENPDDETDKYNYDIFRIYPQYIHIKTAQGTFETGIYRLCEDESIEEETTNNSNLRYINITSTTDNTVDISINTFDLPTLRSFIPSNEINIILMSGEDETKLREALQRGAAYVLTPSQNIPAAPQIIPATPPSSARTGAGTGIPPMTLNTPPDGKRRATSPARRTLFGSQNLYNIFNNAAYDKVIFTSKASRKIASDFSGVRTIQIENLPNFKSRIGVGGVAMLFRYFQFLDSVHDLCDSARGVWGTSVNRISTYRNLGNLYAKDIRWILNNNYNGKKLYPIFENYTHLDFFLQGICLNTDATDISGLVFRNYKYNSTAKIFEDPPNDKYIPNTTEMVDITAFLFKKYLNIVKRNPNPYIRDKCSNSLYNGLADVIGTTAYITDATIKHLPYLAVGAEIVYQSDAESNKTKLCGVMQKICDATGNLSRTTVKYSPNAITSEYDAAWAQASTSYINKLATIPQQRTIIAEPSPTSLELDIKCENISLMNIVYRPTRIHKMVPVFSALIRCVTGAYYTDILQNEIATKDLIEAIRFFHNRAANQAPTTYYNSLGKAPKKLDETFGYVKNLRKSPNKTAIVNDLKWCLNHHSQLTIATINFVTLEIIRAYSTASGDFYTIPQSKVPFSNVDLSGNRNTSLTSSVRAVTEGEHYLQNSQLISEHKKIKECRGNTLYRCWFKSFGDLGQILEFHTKTRHRPLSYTFIPIFLTFDRLCADLSIFFNEFTILEEQGQATGITFYKKTGFFGFGKVNNQMHNKQMHDRRRYNISKRLKLMTDSELKNKLKLVGLKITKNVKGKRKYLSRKELETKARLFNKLQNTAKRMKIKIMYKSRNGMYKYKTYIRLQKEINSKYNKNRKYKKPFVRNFNFG
jgi:hypothetical protein